MMMCFLVVFIHQFPEDSYNQNVHRKSIKLEVFYKYISDRIYWWIKFNNAVSCQWAPTLNHTIYSNENKIDYYDWIITKQKTPMEPNKSQIQLYNNFFCCLISKKAYWFDWHQRLTFNSHTINIHLNSLPFPSLRFLSKLVTKNQMNLSIV